MSYVELQVTTNFTFLRGGSHPEELVEQAVLLGYEAIAITDRNTLAGVVRAHIAAKGKPIKLIPGCRLELQDGPSLLAYPTNRADYESLSQLLSVGNLRTEKGKCLLRREDVYRHARDMKFVLIAPSELNESHDFPTNFQDAAKAYKEVFGPNLYLAACRYYTGSDVKKLFRLSELSKKWDIPLAAVNDVHYHSPARRALQDILTCIREKCTIYNAGFRLHQNAERHLKPVSEMQRLFSRYPQALDNARAIADACHFSLSELEYIYPQEITQGHHTPQQYLTHLVWQGAKERFGEQIPESLRRTIEFELDFVARRNYAAYFLTVYDLVRFARDRDILCQGRGSAANSVICFCLGITSVNPLKFKLLFARFMSDARNEPPDIDVDFEHERREEVIQYIYEKYGRNRSAIVATVTQVHKKGAIRDVAKAMGLSADMITRLSKTIRSEWFDHGNDISVEGFNLDDPHLMKTLELTRQYIGFPRQLGQHTGGFVITETPITALCPILHARMENRTCIEWNKDDIEALGFLKVDVLALGMLTCIRKAFDLVWQHYGLKLTLANIPQDDAAVYEMICRADTIGVFQIESRAQMSMLPRLKPKEFYDLVIEVAIVRPGPIQGEMVHPYLRRRNGQEPVEYPSAELKEILGRTLGVPLFQEQAMEIAIVAAGFSPAEADELRRSMASFKANGKLGLYEAKLVKGMVERGYQEDFAKKVFSQLKGFEGYGFPESHSVSFALLVYVSSWLKCHYPDAFGTAILNSQPMGFYSPSQLVNDARKHKVTVLPVDINHSDWDHTMEGKIGRYYSIRLGFRLIKGIRKEDIDLLVAGRKVPFASINALRDLGLPLSTLEKLADADAFQSIHLDRREALWEVLALHDNPEGIFEGQPSATAFEEDPQLPPMLASEHVLNDYATTSLSLKNHPMSFIRPMLQQLGVTATGELENQCNGSQIKVAGLVLVKQRPGTANGTCFVTIEDETGTSNLVIFRNRFERYRREILHARLLMVEGKLQVESGVMHVIVSKCYDQSALLLTLSSPPIDHSPPVQKPAESHSEDNPRRPPQKRKKRQEQKSQQLEIFPTGRSFR